MPRPSVLTVAAVTVAVALAGLAGPVRAQDAPRRLKPLTPSLDAVLPLLNTAVVRVRTPSDQPLPAGDAARGTARGTARDAAREARDGVTTTHLTGIRVGDELAIVSVPDVAPAPTSYDVALYDRWLPAPVLATDESGLYALLRVTGRREGAPTLAAAPIAPGFVVRAVSVGPTLDIRTVWLEPEEKIDLPPGAAVWAVDGRFVGLTSTVDGGTIIIPGADVLASAEELAAKVKSTAGPAR